MTLRRPETTDHGYTGTYHVEAVRSGSDYGPSRGDDGWSHGNNTTTGMRVVTPPVCPVTTAGQTVTTIRPVVKIYVVNRV